MVNFLTKSERFQNKRIPGLSILGSRGAGRCCGTAGSHYDARRHCEVIVNFLSNIVGHTLFLWGGLSYNEAAAKHHRQAVRYCKIRSLTNNSDFWKPQNWSELPGNPDYWPEVKVCFQSNTCWQYSVAWKKKYPRVTAVRKWELAYNVCVPVLRVGMQTSKFIVDATNQSVGARSPIFVLSSGCAEGSRTCTPMTSPIISSQSTVRRSTLR